MYSASLLWCFGIGITITQMLFFRLPLPVRCPSSKSH